MRSVSGGFRPGLSSRFSRLNVAMRIRFPMTRAHGSLVWPPARFSRRSRNASSRKGAEYVGMGAPSAVCLNGHLSDPRMARRSTRWGAPPRHQSHRRETPVPSSDTWRHRGSTRRKRKRWRHAVSEGRTASCRCPPLLWRLHSAEGEVQQHVVDHLQPRPADERGDERAPLHETPARLAIWIRRYLFFLQHPRMW